MFELGPGHTCVYCFWYHCREIVVGALLFMLSHLHSGSIKYDGAIRKVWFTLWKPYNKRCTSDTFAVLWDMFVFDERTIFCQEMFFCICLTLCLTLLPVVKVSKVFLFMTKLYILHTVTLTHSDTTWCSLS